MRGNSKWLYPLAAAAGVAAVSVVAVSVTAGFSSTQASSVVPFEPIPATARVATAPPEPNEPVEANAGTPSCRRNQVRVDPPRQNSSPDHVLVELGVTNTGERCALVTPARVRFLDSRGRPKALEAERENTPLGTTSVRRMLLEPGAAARFRVTATGADCRRLAEGGLQVAVSINDRDEVAADAKQPACMDSQDDDQRSLYVGFWLPQLPSEYLTDAVTPKNQLDGAPLEVTFEEVGRPRAGEAIRFVVALRNAGRDPVSLSPCPAYRMTVAGGSGRGTEVVYTLNCEEAPGTIEPGRTLRFEMLAETPAGVTGASLGWFLGPLSNESTPKGVADVEFAQS